MKERMKTEFYLEGKKKDMRRWQKKGRSRCLWIHEWGPYLSPSLQHLPFPVWTSQKQTHPKSQIWFRGWSLKHPIKLELVGGANCKGEELEGRCYKASEEPEKTPRFEIPEPLPVLWKEEEGLQYPPLVSQSRPSGHHIYAAQPLSTWDTKWHREFEFLSRWGYWRLVLTPNTALPWS